MLEWKFWSFTQLNSKVKLLVLDALAYDLYCISCQHIVHTLPSEAGGTVSIGFSAIEVEEGYRGEKIITHSS